MQWLQILAGIAFESPFPLARSSSPPPQTPANDGTADTPGGAADRPQPTKADAPTGAWPT